MANKGPPFERQVCKRLGMWWTDGVRDDVFWRTSQSGGRATSRGKKGKKTANQEGDVCATDADGLPFLKCFAVEIKRGYNRAGSLADLLDQPTEGKKPVKCLYAKWVEQAERSREQSGARFWLIVFKRDKKLPCVILPTDFTADWPILLRCEPALHTASGAFATTLEEFLARLSRKDVEMLCTKR